MKYSEAKKYFYSEFCRLFNVLIGLSDENRIDSIEERRLDTLYSINNIINDNSSKNKMISDTNKVYNDMIVSFLQSIANEYPNEVRKIIDDLNKLMQDNLVYAKEIGMIYPMGNMFYNYYYNFKIAEKNMKSAKFIQQKI